MKCSKHPLSWSELIIVCDLMLSNAFSRSENTATVESWLCIPSVIDCWRRMRLSTIDLFCWNPDWYLLRIELSSWCVCSFLTVIFSISLHSTLISEMDRKLLGSCTFFPIISIGSIIVSLHFMASFSVSQLWNSGIRPNKPYITFSDFYYRFNLDRNELYTVGEVNVRVST